MVNAIIISLVLFFVAAIFEIGGGYLVWLWLRMRKGLRIGLLGAPVLFIYATILTLQPAHFSRVYAVYGGIFIVSSIIWGFIIDKKKPDVYEIVGAGVALLGAAVMMYAPR